LSIHGNVRTTKITDIYSKVIALLDSITIPMAVIEAMTEASKLRSLVYITNCTKATTVTVTEKGTIQFYAPPSLLSNGTEGSFSEGKAAGA